MEADTSGFLWKQIEVVNLYHYTENNLAEKVNNIQR